MFPKQVLRIAGELKCRRPISFRQWPRKRIPLARKFHLGSPEPRQWLQGDFLGHPRSPALPKRLKSARTDGRSQRNGPASPAGASPPDSPADGGHAGATAAWVRGPQAREGSGGWGEEKSKLAFLSDWEFAKLGTTAQSCARSPPPTFPGGDVGHWGADGVTGPLAPRPPRPPPARSLSLLLWSYTRNHPLPPPSVTFLGINLFSSRPSSRIRGPWTRISVFLFLLVVASFYPRSSPNRKFFSPRATSAGAPPRCFLSRAL